MALHAWTHYQQAQAKAQQWSQQGPPVVALQADLRQPEQVQRMFEALDRTWGRVDVLVNTAAVWEAVPLEKLQLEHIVRHWEVNALGSFLCALEAGRRMVHQQQGGVIINFGDWATQRPYVNYAAYFASKGAVEALTRALAVELGTRNPRVRVNAILPGPVLWPPELSPSQREQIQQATLTQSAGDPQAVVRAVEYLIENSFVTGQLLVVDGGRSIFCPQERN